MDIKEGDSPISRRDSPGSLNPCCPLGLSDSLSRPSNDPVPDAPTKFSFCGTQMAINIAWFDNCDFNPLIYKWNVLIDLFLLFANRLQVDVISQFKGLNHKFVSDIF